MQYGKSFVTKVLQSNRGCGILANGLKVASTARAALKDLARKDLAYKSDEGWIVYDRLFAEWLRSLP